MPDPLPPETDDAGVCRRQPQPWPAVNAVKYEVLQSVDWPCKLVSLKGFYVCLGFRGEGKGTRTERHSSSQGVDFCAAQSPHPGLQGQTQALSHAS